MEKINVFKLNGKIYKEISDISIRHESKYIYNEEKIKDVLKKEISKLEKNKQQFEYLFKKAMEKLLKKTSKIFNKNKYRKIESYLDLFKKNELFFECDLRYFDIMFNKSNLINERIEYFSILKSINIIIEIIEKINFYKYDFSAIKILLNYSGTVIPNFDSSFFIDKIETKYFIDIKFSSESKPYTLIYDNEKNRDNALNKIVNIIDLNKVLEDKDDIISEINEKEIKDFQINKKKE